MGKLVFFVTSKKAGQHGTLDCDFSRSQYDVVAVAVHCSPGLSVRTRHLRAAWPDAKRLVYSDGHADSHEQVTVES